MCSRVKMCKVWTKGYAACADRLLRAVVLALLHVLAGECDGRVSYRSVDLLYEAIGLLLYPHFLPYVYQSVPVRHEIKTASSVRHRGLYHAFHLLALLRDYNLVQALFHSGR